MAWYHWMLILFFVMTVIHQLEQIVRSLRNTEEMVRRLMAHQGVEWSVVAEPSPAVKQLARTPGSEVEAIKAYREQTGLGLKEARAVVDRLARAPRSGT